MPVIFRTKSLRFCIFTDDHGNPHVHVLGPDGEVKIFLETLEVSYSKGFSEKSVRRILKKAKERKDVLLEAWEDYHGKD